MKKTLIAFVLCAIAGAVWAGGNKRIVMTDGTNLFSEAWGTGGTNMSTWTNNIGYVQVQHTGDVTIAGNLTVKTNYFIYVSATNNAGIWMDYSAWYVTINSNGTIRTTTNAWGW